MFLDLIRHLFSKREKIRSDIYVTSGGGFGMKSGHLFKNKQETLDLLDKINKIIDKRWK